LNRLEQILAARALSASGADEGLLCDPHGNVIEAVSANLFIRTGDTLVTPDVAHCGVGGVAREHVLEVAPALGYEPQVAPLRRGDVVAADEVFLTNALRGARPVASLDGVRWHRFAAARAVHGVLSGEVLLP
ncbi:MAG: aminotransferase class IV, partial [Pseudomonadota bacterium]